MSTDVKSPLPTSAVDAQGRLLPQTAEQRAERKARMLASLKAIAAIPDEPGDDAAWPEVLRSIDEGRPERKLFEGMY